MAACDKPTGDASANNTAAPAAATAAPAVTPTPSPAAPPKPAEKLRVRVLRKYPHDPGAFTQGLVFHDGTLYESTGLPGRSSLRRVDLETGRVEARVDLGYPLFGEGLALVGTELHQLTWQDGRDLVWDMATLKKVREHRYHGEGWGLCYDGRRLVMSDGSDQLVFRDPATFAETGRVSVRHQGQPLRQLNELECAAGAIYANVWQDTVIVRIDPTTGSTTGWADASGLLTHDEIRNTDVLNGIAYVPATGHFLITGKLWPRLFEVELLPAAAKD